MEYAKLISKVNNHNRSLNLLGILPNQLRTLIKMSGVPDIDAVFEDISKSLFWKGYTLWNTRKRLIANFWNNIAPDEWKPHKKKRYNPRVIQIEKKCARPFHFLVKHSDLSYIRPSQCTCSRVRSKKAEKFVDISLYFHKTSQVHDIISPENNNLNSIQSRPCLYKSRSDLIRSAHDRGKKYHISK
jgi:hypothetical protein